MVVEIKSYLDEVRIQRNRFGDGIHRTNELVPLLGVPGASEIQYLSVHGDQMSIRFKQSHLVYTGDVINGFGVNGLGQESFEGQSYTTKVVGRAVKVEQYRKRVHEEIIVTNLGVKG